MFTTPYFTPATRQSPPRFYPTFRDLSARAQTWDKTLAPIKCSHSALRTLPFPTPHLHGRIPTRSGPHSPFRTPHTELRIPNSALRTLTPHSHSLRYIHVSAYPFSAHQIRAVFPRYFTPRAPPRYSDSPKRTSLYLWPKLQNPRFPREKRTFTLSRGPSAKPNQVQRPLAIPLFDQSKPAVFPGKYAHHLNSVLSGFLYLQKTLVFQTQMPSKPPSTPQKQKPCRPPDFTDHDSAARTRQALTRPTADWPARG
jgi:hypothetical protein